MFGWRRLNNIVVTVLCFTWVSVVLAAEPKVGQVSALLQGAKRNAKLMELKDSIAQNDVLTTNSFGRVRAELLDGSILSLGSGSLMKVTQYDATSRQTQIELTAGRIRSLVQKITAPAGKFQIRTPNAVIGVIGTDFFVEYERNRTTVICYVGQVVATPASKSKVDILPNAGGLLPDGSVRVYPNQMTVITSEPSGGWALPRPPPQGMLEANIETSIRQTQIPDGYTKSPGPQWLREKWERVTVGAVVTGAVVAALIVTNSGGGKPLSPMLP